MTEYNKEIGWFRYEENRNKAFFSFNENGVTEKPSTEYEEGRYGR